MKVSLIEFIPIVKIVYYFSFSFQIPSEDQMGSADTQLLAIP